MANGYIFDDGSVESKLLQETLHVEGGVDVIKVGKYDKLDNWLTVVLEENDDIFKVYLPFCYDQITPGLRAEINMALYNYPKLRIVLPFEQMDKRTIEAKATNLKIEKLMEENRDKAKMIDYGKYTVGGNDSPAGKPEEPKKKKRVHKLHE